MKGRRGLTGPGLVLGGMLLLAGPVQATDCLDESQWMQLQQQSYRHPALLYVWSPRMVLSAVHADEVRQAARQEGLRLVPVHDHRLPAGELEQALQYLRQQVPAAAEALAGSVPLCNDALVQQEAYRHFPTAWVVRRGAYHPFPLVAAMPVAYWRAGIRERFGERGHTRRNQDAGS